MPEGITNLKFTQGSRVLLLWSSKCLPSDVKDLAEALQNDTISIQLENLERLHLANHSNSVFDVALCGLIEPSVDHDEAMLAEVLRLLKPGGKIILRETASDKESNKKVLSKLKLAGFIDCVEDNGMRISSAFKPNYEIGFSSQLKLSFGNKQTKNNGVEKEAAQVWSLDSADMLDDELELIDDDKLLNDDDLKKPDPLSLRAACGPGSGKKRACKGCTCGLAEELDNNSTGAVKLKSKTVTSACGSAVLPLSGWLRFSYNFEECKYEIISVFWTEIFINISRSGHLAYISSPGEMYAGGKVLLPSNDSGTLCFFPRLHAADCEYDYYEYYEYEYCYEYYYYEYEYLFY